MRINRTNLVSTIGSLVLLAAAGTASAAPLAPPPDFEPDTGANLFESTGTVIAVEIFDAFDGIPNLTEVGFYFEGDSGNRNVLFDSGDLAFQGAEVDFGAGTITDTDSMEVTNFTPSTGAFGFYVTIAAAITLFSEETLNPLLGVPPTNDFFTAWQSSSNPDLIGIAFEGVDENGLLTPIYIGNVFNIAEAKVPEPGTHLLLGFGLALFLVRRYARR